MKVGYTYSTISKLPKELRPEDVGKQISVEGIVSRISEVLEYPFKVTFVCQTCGHEIVAEYKPWEKPTKPKKCEECNSKNIKIDPLKSFSRRYQLLRIQDPPEALTEGVPPTHVDGIVIDSLVGSLKLGARVRVTGVLTAASRNSSGNRGFVLKNVLEVTHVDIIGKESPGDSVTDQDIRRFHEEVQKKDFKQRIIQSMIPIRGYDSLKEGLLLAVLGGAETWLPDGTKLRRNIHVLIVDEQQKASQILSPIVEIMPRVIHVEGSNIQRSELVAKPVRDDLTMERVIQAGPLVLANEGVFILEDLDKLSKLDNESLAKVMEQEVAFLPKADVVGKFSIKTTVIAVAAPKSGVIDKSKSLASQLNVTPGLLNAFDLVYIMSNATSGEQAKNERLYSISPLWASRESYYDREFIRKFIAYARSLNPVLSVEALETIYDYYTRNQYKHTVFGFPMSIRNLQSIMRLAIAHARLYLREVITKEDARAAIELFGSTLLNLEVGSGQEICASTKTRTRLTKLTKIELIVDIIERLESLTEFGAPKEKIVEIATTAGIPKNEVYALLNHLETDATVYQPKQGYYKVLK